MYARLTVRANMIKGKQPEEIRKLFNIQNDFTPEEEAQIRRENVGRHALTAGMVRRSLVFIEERVPRSDGGGDRDVASAG